MHDREASQVPHRRPEGSATTGDFTSDLAAVMARLESERPIPTAAFRGELRRRLLTEAGMRGSSAQRTVGALIAFAGSGLSLLAVAAIGIAGLGPFAA
jgi:hypothetical protein